MEFELPPPIASIVALLQWTGMVAFTSKWTRVASGIRTENLRTGGDGRLRTIDGTSSVTRVLRLDQRRLIVESTFESSPEALDIAVLSNGQVWLTEVTGLRRQDASVPDVVNQKLWRPTVLAAAGASLYVLSNDGRFLYRRDEQGRFFALDLLDVSLTDAYVRQSFQRGLQPLDGQQFALLAGRHVLRLDLRQANWRGL